MKKVTRLLLVASVAAMGVGVLGACSDDVTVVQPPPPEPPPPPPPPPPEEAELSIQAIRDADDNTVVDPDDVNGRIIVVLNVEPGDQGVTQIDLLVDDAPVGCQTVAAGSLVDAQASLSGAGADTVECFLNTARGLGECTGDQLDPEFQNGARTLGARVTLDDGSTITAENAQQLTFTNQNTLQIVRLTGDPGVVGSGVRYFGGVDLEFAACPVDFDGRTIDQVSLAGAAFANGDADGDAAFDGSVDLGSGQGAAHTIAAPPFLFVADAAANQAPAGEEVEDDPAGTGHTIGMGVTILTDEGEDVTASYAVQQIAGIFLDFRGPTIDPGAFITIDALANNNGHYSAGDFGLSAAVTDFGVGFDNSATTFNVNDDVGGALFLAAAVGIGDLLEDDNADDGDANGVDTYEVEVTEVADRLGNPSSAADLANITPNPDGPFGVDRTAPAISNLQPDTDPADDPLVVLNDVTVMFDAADPLLESGDPGSGVDNAGCGAGCTAIQANAGALTVTEPAAGSFSVDITPLADGEQTVTVDVPDLAVLTPNTASDDFTFILDTTGPQFGALNPAPQGSAGTDATSIIQTIGGTITDANAIASAVISVFADGDDAVGTNSNGTCETTDHLLDVATDEIDRNEIDVTSGTNSIDFNESFEIAEPTSASVTVTYCFIIEAADEAVDKTGADNPNESDLRTEADVNWLN